MWCTRYLLVDDDEAALLAVAGLGLVAHLLLQLDDLVHAARDVLALRLQQSLALRRRLVEETRVDLAKLELRWTRESSRDTYVFSNSSDTLQVSTKAFSTLFGMSGWRPPWSSTRPRISFVSSSLSCCIS